MRKSKLAGAIAFSLLTLNVHALSVGNMNVASYLGEPLNISIDLNSIDSAEYETLKVSLASRAMFEKAQIEYPANASKISVEVGEYENGQATVLVKTPGAVTDPFVHLLLNIAWSGGNILREYTALLDPVDYKVSPVTQAAAPATSIGITQPAGMASGEDMLYTVKAGDSLSAIASKYLPSGVSGQQAWIAIYHANPDAFHNGNLNYLKQGARLRIPSESEMKAVPKTEALAEVKNKSQPLTATKTEPMAVSSSEAMAEQAPTLVVGGSGDINDSESAETASEPMDAQPAVVAPVISANEIAPGAAANTQEVQALVNKLNTFTQSIEQEVSGARERDVAFKDELIATRGENRELNKRLANLETQISKMTQLLELQSRALEQLNTGGAGAGQIAEVQAALDKLAQTPPVAMPEQQPEATAGVVPPAETEGAAPEGEKTYYEQLMDEALSRAPEEDKSYIDQVLGESSTSIGQEDTSPVTMEMKARAAAEKSAAPAPQDAQTTEDMLANVRQALGDKATGEPGTARVETPLGEVEIGSQDKAYIDALNEEDRSQIEKSEARIAELERQLQEKIKAAQQGAGQPAEQVAAPAATEQPPAAEQTQATGAMEKPSMAAQDHEPEGLADTLKQQATDAFDTVVTTTKNLSDDSWRIIGGAGVVIIGLMLISGMRRRKDENLSDDSSIVYDESSTADVADMAAESMAAQNQEIDELEEELHGSSLFDLSDESFMASEAIQDDSSLFAMDDELDSLANVDTSEQIGGQSTMTQMVDVDPVAEADVYLAYDRTEQAIEVLEHSLAKDPGQAAVVIKLLGLYQGQENIEAFSKLFESSVEHIENEDDWNKIKNMAQHFVPGHELLADDFDSSIPVLNEALSEESPEQATAAAEEGESDALDSLSSTDLGLEDTESIEEAAPMALDEELDSATEEINQHEPDTALALAKAYIELGEENIAKDFLQDVINGDSGELKAEAEQMLASLG